MKKYNTTKNINEMTKEEKTNYNKNRKATRTADFEKYITNYCKKNGYNVLTYDNCNGLYRLQVEINGRFKTIARIKAQKDIYILIRESTAIDNNIAYELINYNLPAGFHVGYDYIREVTPILDKICKYHIEKQAV